MKFMNNSDTESLLSAILLLKNLDEAKNFFRDLLTEAEIVEFSKRWQVAQLLNDGVSYTQIEKSTGLSSTTIARVSKYLKGENKGYRSVLERFQKGLHHAHHVHR